MVIKKVSGEVRFGEEGLAVVYRVDTHGGSGGLIYKLY